MAPDRCAYIGSWCKHAIAPEKTDDNQDFAVLFINMYRISQNRRLLAKSRFDDTAAQSR